MENVLQSEFLKSDNIAIKDIDGNSITYNDLYIESRMLIKKISNRNLIIILCDYKMDTLQFIYKALVSGNVPLLLSGDIDIQFLDELIKLYKPNFLWCKKDYQLVKRYNEIEIFQEHILLKIHDEKVELYSELALLLSTSGSTGSHKMVKLTYKNLYSNAKNTIRRCGIHSNQKGIVALPLNYTYGFSFVLWHWLSGATILISGETVISKKFLNFFILEQVNNFAAIPYMYEMMNRIAFWNNIEINTLNFVMCGGAKITEQLEKKMLSILENKFYLAYGQTEATCIISVTNFKEANIKYGTVGKPLDNLQIEVDENGELMVKGESVSMGYAYSYEQLVTGDDNQQILRTGDRAEVDEDGFIYLKGRMNRYIKILGKRISLDEIEVYLTKNFNNIQFACIGGDNSVIIYYEENGIQTEKVLEEEIKLKLDNIVKIPSKFIKCIKLFKLPRNEAGKVLYLQLGKDN